MRCKLLELVRLFKQTAFLVLKNYLHVWRSSGQWVFLLSFARHPHNLQYSIILNPGVYILDIQLYHSKAQQVEDDPNVLRPCSFIIGQCFYALLLLCQVWGFLLAQPPRSLSKKLDGLGVYSQGIRCRVTWQSWYCLIMMHSLAVKVHLLMTYSVPCWK